MKQYHDLLKQIIAEGTWEDNRTGIRTISIPGAMLKFDLRDGFPAVTTKKLAFRGVMGELIGFLRGCTSAADFRALGCKVWDQNANENSVWLASSARQGEDDLGKLGYSHGWRNFGGDRAQPGSGLDQIARALFDVRYSPTSRRNLTLAWNPAELGDAALPPCHVLFQLIARQDGTLHMVMYQRSVDTFLGLPFNIASYAALLHLFAAWSGRTAATLSMMLADVHIYENHMEQVQTQLSREPYKLPKLLLRTDGTAHVDDLETLLAKLDNSGEFPTFDLIGYEHRPAIAAPMAV